MIYYHKKSNMICYDQEDLRQLFEAPSRKKISEIIKKSGYSSYDLLRDKKKMEELVVGMEIVNDKEDKEIFSALYHFSEFYKNTQKINRICFLLKDDVNPEKEKIDTLEKLKSYIKEKDLNDFFFWHDDGFRSYQLKSYQGNSKIEEFFNFLKRKLLHYGNDLGETNLLINLESTGPITGDFFQDLEKRIQGLGLKGTGHILVSYNEENKYYVINTVYPKLGTTRIEARNNKDGK